MTSKNLRSFNRAVTVIYLRRRGGTAAGIAVLMNMSKKGVEGILTRNRVNPRVQAAVALKEQEMMGPRTISVFARNGAYIALCESLPGSAGGGLTYESAIGDLITAHPTYFEVHVTMEEGQADGDQ